MIARNNPIPAPIPNLRLLGIEFINHDLIGVSEIIKNKTLEGVVTGYYESIPTLTFAKARISFFDSVGPRDTQFWHSDPGSYRVLKALIYLNDVDENGGPFEIISGSHFKKFQISKARNKKRRRRKCIYTI